MSTLKYMALKCLFLMSPVLFSAFNPDAPKQRPERQGKALHTKSEAVDL